MEYRLDFHHMDDASKGVVRTHIMSADSYRKHRRWTAERIIKELGESEYFALEYAIDDDGVQVLLNSHMINIVENIS
jgi:hypothetical protein